MLKKFVLFYLKIHLMILLCQASLPADTENSNNADGCLNNSLEAVIWCRGSRALKNALNNLSKTNKPVVIVRGLELVPSAAARQNQHLTNYTSDNDASNNNINQANGNLTDNTVDDGDTDDTFLGRFSRYLGTHELNIKFSDLLADVSERRQYMARELDQSGMQMDTMSGEGKLDMTRDYLILTTTKHTLLSCQYVVAVIRVYFIVCRVFFVTTRFVREVY